MAAEMRIDLRQVKGTGPGGRIIKRDVEAYLAAPAAAAAPLRPASAAAAPAAGSSAQLQPPLRLPIPLAPLAVASAGR